jgi:hypothetical protein
MANVADSLRRVRRRLSRSLLREELDRQQDLLYEKVKRDLEAELAAVRQAWTGAEHELGFVHGQLEHLEGVAQRPPWSNLIGGPLDKLDSFSAAFLNYAVGEYGFAAQAGLRLQPELELAYSAGSAAVIGVSARVFEIPFVVQALTSLPADSRVLVVEPDTALPVGLAELGFHVIALARDGFPLEHPRLEVIAQIGDGPYDAVVALLGRDGPAAVTPEPAAPGAPLIASLAADDADAEEVFAGWTVDEVRPAPAARRRLVRGHRPA